MTRKLPVLFTALSLLCFSCNEGTVQKDSGDRTVDLKLYSAIPDSAIAPREMKAEEFNTEGYDAIVENAFQTPVQHPYSTFSIDVDEAAYSNIRRYIQYGDLPPKGAVRIEEMINYFDYEYAQPQNNEPFALHTEVAECPWNKKHRLVHIGLQGLTIPVDDLPASNLVFLIDVSGSMDEPDKLPLLKTSLKLLVNQMREKDRLAIVVYAGSAGLVLPSVKGSERSRILSAIEELQAGGSTAGGEGIRLAYQTAKDHFIKGGNNRVILATDGDFNIGISSEDELVSLIEEERKSGVFLSVLGFGTGNYQDSKMQQLADKGNGNHSYIDNINEARKVLVSEMGSTLFAIAKDVKIQVEFNPQFVQAYRLIGYENRMLAAEDFNDDSKDAGELGSGHTVTALYEIIPTGVESVFVRQTDPLKFQQASARRGNNTRDLMHIKLRYKSHDGDNSSLIVHDVPNISKRLNESSDNFRFSAAVASFGMILRESEYKQQSNYDLVLNLARSSSGKDPEGYRKEFIELVQAAIVLSR